MQTHQLRRQFLEYFKKRGHAVIASSPVIPHDDPTLLFINAGMNQFKDVFLGNSIRDYTRAATSQKCIRVGGKHNDLENVGHTSRHLTFFEMLGNFSFGDYFKKEAISFAWEVATEVLKFDPDRIWPTVFRDDDEAFELWAHFVPRERITRFGEKENFWAMGDVGPCGPCSELLYDRGSEYGPARNPSEDATGERYLEFWNLVFMQFNRSPEGVLEPLPKPSIDTGAGLERIMSLKLNVNNVFETDVLRGLIAQVESISGKSYHPEDPLAPAFRVIADHLRCLSFAIADGVQPSNVDRGYVLRKVLRRAVRYGRQLGLEEPFLAKVFPRLLEEMGGDYRELEVAKGRIMEILTGEEEAFLRTLRRGGNILNHIIEKAQGSDKTISGDDAFKLKDTYGLPLEEILLLAKDNELAVDTERYGTLELEAKERSRSTQKVTQQIASANVFADFVEKNGETVFTGYQETVNNAIVQAIVVEDQFVECISQGQTGLVILDHTPFYAEMGGQMGDMGQIQSAHALFKVTDCRSPFSGVIAHEGVQEAGELQVGEAVIATVDKARRQKIANNHTATHLLHWALHTLLGEHIKQAGSVVEPNRLRFDFCHHKALSQDEINAIEDLVNQKIRENYPVQTYELAYDEAQKRSDIKQFFGEKYGSKVRVIDIEDFSKELCGGTHVQQLGNLGLFKIAKESSIAAGVRRIEAVTGGDAEALFRQSEMMLEEIAQSLKTPVPKLSGRLAKLLEENKQLNQELKNIKKGAVAAAIEVLFSKSESIRGLSFIGAQVDFQGEELRALADGLSNKLDSGIIVLATIVNPENCQLIVRVSDDLVAKGMKASELVKAIAPLVGGSGGGKANSAQAGGKAPEGVPSALEKAREFVAKES